MTFKLIVSDLLCPVPGSMFVLDNAREAYIGFNPAPFVATESEPMRLIVCHPSDEVKVREAMADIDAEEVS